MKKLAFIVIHYGSSQITLDCLKTLAKQSKQNFKLFLVNNSTEKLFQNKIKDLFFSLIEPKSNLGFASGNNLALRQAYKEGFEYIILLNNDTLLPSDFSRKLESLARLSSADLFSPKIYFAKGFEYQRDRYKKNEKGKVIWYAGGIIDRQNFYAKNRGIDEVDTGQYNKKGETGFVTGCCLVIKKHVLENLGMLDEALFLYYEDVEYSLRAKVKGLKIFYEPEVFLWHKNAQSSPGPGSDLHRYYQTRNRLSLGIKYASLRAKKSLIIESLRHILAGGIERKAVLDFYAGNMGSSRVVGDKEEKI